MKHPYPDIESTVKRYVLGQMSDAEVEDFEDYYFDKPDIMDLIETTQNIHAGLESSGVLRDTTQSLERDEQPSVLGKLAGVMTVSVPAYVVVALLASSLLIPNFQASNPTDSQNRDISLVHFSTATQRGSSDTAQLDLSDVTGQAVVLIKLKSVDYQYHVARLSDKVTGEIVWTSEPFEVGALSEKLILLPDDLTAATLELSVMAKIGALTNQKVHFCHFSEECS